MALEEYARPRVAAEASEGPKRPVKLAGFALDELGEEESEHRGKARKPFGQEVFGRLMDERQQILADPALSTKQKLQLLDSNRKALVIATGGTLKKTENVVYGILVFGGLLVAVLALLTVFADLPTEITLTFVGTVLGGTIATIAQKLGKI